MTNAVGVHLDSVNKWKVRLTEEVLDRISRVEYSLLALDGVTLTSSEFFRLSNLGDYYLGEFSHAFFTIKGESRVMLQNAHDKREVNEKTTFYYENPNGYVVISEDRETLSDICHPSRTPVSQARITRKVNSQSEYFNPNIVAAINRYELELEYVELKRLDELEPDLSKLFQDREELLRKVDYDTNYISNNTIMTNLFYMDENSNLWLLIRSSNLSQDEVSSLVNTWKEEKD